MHLFWNPFTKNECMHLTHKVDHLMIQNMLEELFLSINQMETEKAEILPESMGSKFLI